MNKSLLSNNRSYSFSNLACELSLVVVALICLSLAAHHAIEFVETQLTGVDWHDRAGGWRLLKQLPGDLDCLVIGDSTGQCGVSPRVLDEKLKVNSVNLCTSSYEMLTGAAWMLDMYIAKYGPPHKVILVNHSLSWYAAPSTVKSIPLLPWELYRRTPRPSFQFSDWLHSALNSTFALYSRNRTLQQMVRGPWDFERKLMILEKGFAPARYHDAENFEKNEIAIRKAKPFPELIIHPENQEAIRAIEERAREHDFYVYLVDGPVYDGLLKLDSYNSFVEQHRSAMIQLTRENSRLIWMPRSVVFPRRFFLDMNHLQYAGALYYSRAIAAFINSNEPPVASLEFLNDKNMPMRSTE